MWYSDMEGPRRVPPVTVRRAGWRRRRRRARPQRQLVRVLAFRLRQALVPRDGAGHARAGARRRTARARVPLGAAQRHEAVGP